MAELGHAGAVVGRARASVRFDVAKPRQLVASARPSGANVGHDVAMARDALAIVRHGVADVGQVVVVDDAVSRTCGQNEKSTGGFRPNAFLKTNRSKGSVFLTRSPEWAGARRALSRLVARLGKATVQGRFR